MKKNNIFISVCVGLALLLSIVAVTSLDRKNTPGSTVEATESASTLKSSLISNKLHFNLGINKQALEFFMQNEEYAKPLENKIGRSLEKSSINIQFYDFKRTTEKTLETNNLEEYSNFAKGVIKTPEGNFNFQGHGDLYLVKLESGEVIYQSTIDGNFKNKKSDENFSISMRYNPNTEDIDISFVSGLIGDSAILSFGTPFISDAEFNEIADKIRQ